MNSFYSKQELQKIGFKCFGKNALVSRKSSIYNAKEIELGSNVRIDDFCILSGKIKIGSYVHISAFCGLYAGDVGIDINDFAGISPHSLVFAISDDFSGEAMIGPMIPLRYRKLISGKVILEKHTQIGAATVILPNLVLKEGSVIGSMSLLTKSTDEWSIYLGCPATKIKNRSKKVLELEKKLPQQDYNE